MRVVAALGGSAQLGRGQPMTAANQRAYVGWGTPDAGTMLRGEAGTMVARDAARVEWGTPTLVGAAAR
jgi:carbamate kinase